MSVKSDAMLRALLDDFENCHREMLTAEKQLRAGAEKMSQQVALSSTKLTREELG